MEYLEDFDPSQLLVEDHTVTLRNFHLHVRQLRSTFDTTSLP